MNIIGSILRRGKQAKLDCPNLQLAYTQMMIRELRKKLISTRELLIGSCS